MGWLAWFGMLLPVVFGLNQLVRQAVFVWSGWIMLWAIGCAGTIAIVYESVRNLRRYRWAAVGRPGVYFEIGRLLVGIELLVVAPLLTAGLLFPNAVKPGFLIFFGALYLCLIVAVAFSVVGIAGHLVSLISGRRCHGRAWECTTWFLTVMGGSVLAAWGFVSIPEKPQSWLETIPGILLMGCGLVLVAAGILNECTRQSASNRR